MPEKSDNEALILIGAGIIIGAAFIFLAMRKQLFQVQASLQLQPQVTQSQPAPQPQALSSSYRQDTEFIKWYTETIIKPSIQQAARESVDKALQFMETNPRTEMQTLEPKTTKPRTKPFNWMITRDSEGAIASIETMKHTSQKELQSTKQPMLLDRINTGEDRYINDARR